MTYLREDKINVRTLNSISSYETNSQYLEGINVIVGGNSLGRGITFPQLQTIYYCRTAKKPQADTMWQHARMFGYDRDPGLLRVYIPNNLFKLFYEINETNNSIIGQIKACNSPKIIYPTGLSPTRKNVIDRTTVRTYSGCVNYFPFAPMDKNIETLDKILKPLTESVHRVSLQLIKRILRDNNKSDARGEGAPCLTPSLVGISSAKLGGVLRKHFCIKIDTIAYTLKTVDLSKKDVSEKVF